MKILLILSDGTRPDSLEGLDFTEKLKTESTYCMNAQTVMPSVTLPCHMSLFHSVDPDRHGTTTNIFTPQVRPVPGLFEQLNAAGKKCAMFYNWEELRDISRPGSLSRIEFVSQYTYGLQKSTEELYKRAKSILLNEDMDFTFLYSGFADETGHEYGWMSKEYIQAVRHICNYTDDLINALENEYTIIFTADHGGHARIHGTDMKEDMTIPLFFRGEGFRKGVCLKTAGIKDIAPTVAKLLGAEIPKEWEGKPINEL